MNAVIDMRSDLLSRPTEAMRRAMADAALASPAFGLREDPAQQALEAHGAALLGHEDALLFPTCTMANQTAIRLFCRPGDVMLAPPDAHVVLSEAGAPGALSGALVQPLPADGQALAALLAAGCDAQRPPVRLAVLENTHNRSGGRPLPPARLPEIAAVAAKAGVAIHLDGARLFNAAVAQGVAPATLGAPATSVAVSLNKGLGAPIGALLAGSRGLIEEAVRIRQMLGGGIRPSGIIAAAGLVALADIDRLAEDHARARRLADGLARLGFRLDPATVETNLVLVGCTAPVDLAARLEAQGLRPLPFGADAIRLSVYRDIGDAEIDAALTIFARIGPENAR